jgi:hypothetical protein
MKQILICALILAAVSLTEGQQLSTGAPQSMSNSLGLHSFPAKNQTGVQQQQDEMACYSWAKQDSGFDPVAAYTAQQSAAPATTAPPKTPQTQGAGVKGAAGGAATGAVVGAIAGDAGKGAVAGAAAGTIAGRRRARQAEKHAVQQAQQQQRQEAQQQAQAKAQAQQKLDGFKKGFSACMEGKGYVVK